MKTRLLTALLLLTALALPLRAEIAWRQDYEAALAEAKQSGKPLWLEFSATWCGPCRQMNATTFADADIEEALSHYIPVHVDFDRSPELVGKYRVKGVPAHFLLNQFGEQVATVVGYLDVATTQDWLKTNRRVAFAEVSREQASKQRMQAVEQELRDPAQRTHGIDSLLESYLNKDDFAPTAETLVGDLVESQPDAMRPHLNHPQLAVRILLANKFAKAAGGKLAFDPWETQEARAAAMQALPK